MLKRSGPAWVRTSCSDMILTAHAGFVGSAKRPRPQASTVRFRVAGAKAVIAGDRLRLKLSMAARDPLVVFTPSGKRGHFPVGTPLLQAARSLGVDIDSVCGGRGLCGRCQVLVAEGEFAKHGVSSSGASLSPLSEPEIRYSRRAPLAQGRRLSCSARVEADVVIDVPPSSQVHRQVVRKEADEHVIELNPVVRLHYVQVQQPDMHDPSGDLRRLFEALEAEWGLTDLTCDLAVLQTLQPVLRAGSWQVTVAVHAAKQIIGVWSGLHERAYGLAVDIGSTTIAAHLCDLRSGDVVASAGVMNPQIRFGEDLMSRVSYSMMNPRGPARARGGRGATGRYLARGHSRSYAGREPDLASSAARHRSGRTRRRAICACRRSFADSAGERHPLTV